MYKMKIPTKKTKLRGCKGKVPVTTKMIIDTNTFVPAWKQDRIPPP
jgi:hypothetical protein